MIETSGHLSECPCTAIGVPSCICDDDEECGPQCRHLCICDRLRACEQRVRDEVNNHWREYGGIRYRNGLTDARDAVEVMRLDTDPDIAHVIVSDVLDAIDALAAGQAPAAPLVANGYGSPHEPGCANECKWPPYPGAVCPECSGEAPAAPITFDSPPYSGDLSDSGEAPAAPLCPFPIGAKVRPKGCPTCRILTVTSWGFYPAWGKWFLRVESGVVTDEIEYALMHGWELELVPAGQAPAQTSSHPVEVETAPSGVGTPASVAPAGEDYGAPEVCECWLCRDLNLACAACENCLTLQARCEQTAVVNGVTIRCTVVGPHEAGLGWHYFPYPEGEVTP